MPTLSAPFFFVEEVVRLPQGVVDHRIPAFGGVRLVPPSVPKSGNHRFVLIRSAARLESLTCPPANCP
jgi:hypothetical protein